LEKIEIYTDGSCHTQQKVGAWAAIIFLKNEKKILSDIEFNTTHNRMELIAVMKAISYVSEMNPESKLIIYSDSQYVIGIPDRIETFKKQPFRTKSGKEIQNIDLLKKFISLLKSVNIEFIKVKAHQKKTEIENPNREVDKLSRKIVREYIKNNN
jgi:ribonuclease HI